ncbi:MAG: hotdog fold thioesterase [Bacteroidales bacterium]|nr:hotdog fold thioesterase [Bacteroidales bacterium]MBP5680779.1 hotdog fold thioesterase [Bacteroidales bacterium]
MTLLEKLNQADHFANSIGAQLVEVREGYARAELTVEDRHLNGAGVCQGGVMFTLADLAFAAVANSHGILSVGVQNSISYIKSAQLGDRLSAECFEQVNHHKLPYCDVRITNQQGEVLACVTGLAYRTHQPYEFNTLM